MRLVAAAAEQLGTWAERAGADLVRGTEGGDPSAIIFDAIESASAKVSAGMPDDEACDLDTRVWAGVLPIETRFTKLQADDRVDVGIEPSAALRAMGLLPGEAMMVGDSLTQDIEGARRVGMRGVLVARSGHVEATLDGVPVIRSLRELRALL